MARMGMDVDQVERASRDLKSQAEEIRTLMSRINTVVNGLTSVWDGKDANEFVNNLWPQHKKNLSVVATSIDTLATTAAKNAARQRSTSASL